MIDSICIRPITKRTRFRLREEARPSEKPWRWPLPRLANRSPVILAEHGSDNGFGVDVGYVAAPFVSDLFVPVYAVQAGEVSSAIETSMGFAVGIDHGGRTWGTHYAHLSEMIVTACLPKLRRRQWVRAGEVIGYAAKGPVHVRFGLWQWTNDRGFVGIAPIAHMNDWIVSPTTSELRELVQPTANNEAA